MRSPYIVQSTQVSSLIQFSEGGTKLCGRNLSRLTFVGSRFQSEPHIEFIERTLDLHRHRITLMSRLSTFDDLHSLCFCHLAYVLAVKITGFSTCNLDEAKQGLRGCAGLT